MGEFEKEWSRQIAEHSAENYLSTMTKRSSLDRFKGLFKSWKIDRLADKRDRDQKRYWWSR